MIKKETFCKIIKNMQELDRVCDTFLEFVKIDKMEEFFQVKDNILKSLEEEFNLQDEEYNPIHFFVYESDFGNTNTEVYSSTTNKVIAKLGTPETLYDYLMELT